MTTAKQIVESDELSGRVLGIIGAYGIGAALEARPEPPPEAPRPEQSQPNGKRPARARRARKEPG